MFQLIAQMNRMIHRKREQDEEQGVQYNPEKIESILKEFEDLTAYATDLEKLLRIAEQKTHAYEDLLQKYEKVFLEEIRAYQLQESDVSILHKSYNDNELFLHEIQLQLQTMLQNQQGKAENDTVVTRLFDRFFHQNDLYKSRTRDKLDELNRTISQKRRLLERMQNDMVSWDHKVPPKVQHADPPTPQLGMNRAFG